ncbi:MAG TPA: hypothetical protein VJR46_01000 [Candidatus Dormibacteraeota bacterium]|nr:hypothetical protein [Candidatus Dormibacteraeota bacterium]
MKYLAGLAAGGLALLPLNVAAASPAWELWHPIKGVMDLGGPRTDGNLLVAGSAALYLVGADGTEAAFARGPGGYHEDPGTEAYAVTSPGGEVAAAGCSFTRDDTFLLRLHVPMGITRVSASGEETGAFNNLTGVIGLNGIVFDTGGAFDHRLLVTGAASGKTVVFAIDCNGAVSVVSRSAPQLEGGLAIAPPSFGAFGGDLIAPDENTGKIYAIAPDGKVGTIAKPALPVGGDAGVESLGFVPEGLIARGGAAYFADRMTANSPHSGSDSILRLTSSELAAAGVQEGDLLAATEGGGQMVAIRCQAKCTVTPVVATATKAHGEGHIVFTVTPPPPTPSAAPVANTSRPAISPGLVDFVGTWGVPLGVGVLVLVLLAGAGVTALRRRAR